MLTESEIKALDDAIQRMRKAVADCNEREYEKAQADILRIKPGAHMPLTVAEAQRRRVCRICKLNDNPAPGNPLVLNYGDEYAHEQCLKRNAIVRLLARRWRGQHNAPDQRSAK